MRPGVSSGFRSWLGVLARILLFVCLLVVLGAFARVLAGDVAGSLGSRLILGSALTCAAAIVAGGVLIRRLDDRPVGALGLAWTSRTVWEIGAGLAIGAVALGAAAALMLLVGGLRYTSQPGDAMAWVAAIGSGFGGLALPALAEELIFRGYPFQVLVQAAGGTAATLAASTVFAVAHAANPNVDAFALVNIFLAGVLLSVAYLRTRSLWFATAIHLGWNGAMAAALDLPVSGLELYDTPFYEPVIAGPRWFTGGVFGPEAGLVGTIALGLALLMLARSRRVNVAPEMRALHPLGLPAAGAADAAEAEARSQR